MDSLHLFSQTHCKTSQIFAARFLELLHIEIDLIVLYFHQYLAYNLLRTE